ERCRKPFKREARGDRLPLRSALGAGHRPARKGGLRESRESVWRNAALAGSALYGRRRQRLVGGVSHLFAHRLQRRVVIAEVLAGDARYSNTGNTYLMGKS